MQTISRRQQWWLFAVIALVLQAVGCTELGESVGQRTARRSGDSASRHMLDTSIDAVRTTAIRVFRQDFRLDSDASTDNVFVSKPVELTDYPHRERVRDVLGSPNRHRQIATLWLSQDGPHVMIRCQVRIQRLDTVERAAFAHHRGDDRPTETPIDQVGGTSPNTREEWVPLGRDRPIEARILDTIVQQLAEPGLTQ